MRTQPRSRIPTLPILFLGCLLIPVMGAAQEAATGPSPKEGTSWPVEVVLENTLVVLYQPQPERFEGNRLEGRFVLSAEPADGSGEAVFGTAWFESRIDTDRDDRAAVARDVEVVRVHFPDISPEDASRASATLTAWLDGQEFDMTMDELLTSIERAERRDLSVEGLNMDPPEILYRDRAAVLVMIDGEPILERISDDVMAVVNSAFAILFDLPQTRYYLFAGEDLWYWSREATGPWEFTETVPSRIRDLIPPPDDETGEQMAVAPESMADEPGVPPEIVVVTAPSELIATIGPTQFTPISETELMFIGNTDSDLFFHTPNQEYYVLLSGRWFKASELAGPWAWVPQAELPETFQDIPTDSEVGSIRAHVAGTEEAEEAVLDAQIPQTAAIRRDDRSLRVEYDGDPEWESIEGTTMAFAVNTETPVISVLPRFYAVDGGVWYVADNANGPWTVATSVPDEIYDIPPTSPVYNVTYVEIYETTPEYVVVGHTPGYTNTYVHHTVIVHGTGWWYTPWWHTRYIPRHATWGWHMRWNPWTGWTMGLTWSNGWFTFGIGYSPWRPWCCYRGWWGPRPVPVPFYASRRAAYRAGYRAGFRAGVRAGQANLYRTQRAVPRNAQPALRDRPRATVPADRPRAQPSTRPNNVLADRDGNVHRRTDRGWEQRNPGGGGWTQRPTTRPSQPAARPSQPVTRPTMPTTRPTQPTTRPSQPTSRPSQPTTRQQDLNRSMQQRDRGAARTQQFQQSRPPTARAPARAPTRRRDV